MLFSSLLPAEESEAHEREQSDHARFRGGVLDLEVIKAGPAHVAAWPALDGQGSLVGVDRWGSRGEKGDRGDEKGNKELFFHWVKGWLVWLAIEFYVLSCCNIIKFEKETGEREKSDRSRIKNLLDKYR